MSLHKNPDIAAITAEYLRGDGIQIIGMRHGITYQVVLYHMKKLGIKRKRAQHQTNTEVAGATRSPTTIDIAWAAGIFEGEGNFYATGHTLRASVAQKDRWVLDRFCELFGGRIYENKAREARATQYQWITNNARALGFMFTIYSFLSPRRCAQFHQYYKTTPRSFC